MYDLTKDLGYDMPIRLENKYRYDFLGFDLEPGGEQGLLCGGVFTLRTIKTGNASGNVLIDLIDCSNVNAFDTVIHGDCHFHLLNSDKLSQENEYKVAENIILNIVSNSTSTGFYLTLKNQKYGDLHSISSGDCKNIKPSQYKYLLFTQYHNNPVNVFQVELSPIFRLQEDLVWNNDMYHDFRELHLANKSEIAGHKIEPSTPWEKVKELIDAKCMEWKEKSEKKQEQLLSIVELQTLYPFEE